MDPMESIGEEAQGGVTVGPEGEAVEPMQAPGVGDRLLELFKPCSDEPLAYKGTIASLVNGALHKRSGVPIEEITVGENVAHCVDHLFPGGGTVGWPPIVNLARSVMAYRDAAHRNPDNGKLVRQ